MVLADLMYTSSLTPGTLIVDEFHPDPSGALRPKTVRLIQAVDELAEGYYRITFRDGGVTRALGDERWMRA